MADTSASFCVAIDHYAGSSRILCGGRHGLIEVYEIDGDNLAASREQIGTSFSPRTSPSRSALNGSRSRLNDGRESSPMGAETESLSAREGRQTRPLLSHQAHSEFVRDVAISESFVLTCGSDGDVKVWSRALEYGRTLSGHGDVVTGVSLPNLGGSYGKLVGESSL